jgi:hypothetical protein
VDGFDDFDLDSNGPLIRLITNVADILALMITERGSPLVVFYQITKSICYKVYKKSNIKSYSNRILQVVIK